MCARRRGTSRSAGLGRHDRPSVPAGIARPVRIIRAVSRGLRGLVVGSNGPERSDDPRRSFGPASAAAPNRSASSGGAMTAGWCSRGWPRRRGDDPGGRHRGAARQDDAVALLQRRDRLQRPVGAGEIPVLTERRPTLRCPFDDEAHFPPGGSRTTSAIHRLTPSAAASSPMVMTSIPEGRRTSRSRSPVAIVATSRRASATR